MVIAVLVIALSVLFGFHRSAVSARAEVEEQLYSGADGSGYSIAADLDQRRAAAQNLLVVAGRYLDEGDMAMADVAAAVRALGAAEGPAEKYQWNQALEENTQALLAAIPEPDLDRSRNKKLEIIRGEVTSPIDPKPGCRFAARCDRCTQNCTQSDPKLVEVTPGHFVSCFLVNQS